MAQQGMEALKDDLPCRKRSNCKSYNYAYEYLLEVVTDGSEKTEPTVFLCVSRCSRSSSATQESSSSTLVRYAILGLSEMTARLVADQKLSWANTKAVFCHNNHRHKGGQKCMHLDVNGGGLWGVPGLLLALHQAGASEFTVVTGNENDAERIQTVAEQQLGVHKAHPKVRISTVPLTKQNTDGPVTWWKVYDDPYLIVHGSCPDNRLENLIYLLTCRKHEKVENYTVAVLACPHSRQLFLDIWSVPENRVLLESDLGGGASSQSLSIEVILANGDDEATTKSFLSICQLLLPEAAVFFCRPHDRDSGILLRAGESLEAWHKLLPHNILWRQPPTRSLQQCKEMTTNGTNLATCTSVRCTQPPTIVDRRADILKRISRSIPSADDAKSIKAYFDISAADGEERGVDENEIDIDDLDDEQSTVETDEDNQSDCQSADTEATRRNCPHLLILGTGCAAPSPLRGSSGYGLLLPQMPNRAKTCASSDSSLNESLLLTAIIECGEGTLNSLLRHLPCVEGTMEDSDSLRTHLRHVKFIWISHAHWDHYGGLPAVVSGIHEARMRHHRAKQKGEQQCNKSSRAEPLEPPVLVVAPRKVLDYLNIALVSQDEGQQQEEHPNSRQFQGFTHAQSRSWWPFLASTQLSRVRPKTLHPKQESYWYSYRPFSFWTNVRVEHSCYQAFGFVMGMSIPGRDFAGDQCGTNFPASPAGTPIVTFAYSGDTRPCWSFVEQCRIQCNAFNNGVLDHLLHEASFDDADQAQGVDKKHSSVSEALKVADDAGAKRVILTHFSQRYVSYPPMQLPDTMKGRPVVFAMDGMLLPFY